MRMAVLMDAIEGTYPGETTHYLGRELSLRGHQLAYCTPADLAYEAPRVTATARWMTYSPTLPVTDGEPQRGVALGIELGPRVELDLGTMDVVLMRQDPPVDERYLAATYLLERLGPRTLVVNDPRAVRDTAEKLSIAHFPELAPPTLVTSDPARLRAFRDKHGDLVIKRLFGKGGEGLFFVKRDDKNWNVIVELVGREPVMAQQYLDLPSKKVVVIEGVVVGAVEIEPEPDDIRCNLDRGKRVLRVELTAAETATVAPVARWLGERGILFGVIDLLGHYLIETNVTSPGIAFYFNRLFEHRLEALLADAIEARRR